MKKCSYFKDLILTDYVDGELDKNTATDLESHLLDCSDCRVFFKEVRSTAAAFHQVAYEPVPMQLWEAVKQEIEQKGRAAGFLEGLLEGSKGWIVFPKLVPVLASLVLMLLAGGVSLNTIQINGSQDREQGEYLVALLGSSSASSDNNDLDTPMEQYFL